MEVTNLFADLPASILRRNPQEISCGGSIIAEWDRIVSRPTRRILVWYDKSKWVCLQTTGEIILFHSTNHYPLCLSLCSGLPPTIVL